MTGETEDRLYGLMEVVERQQAAVQAALEGLAAERLALQGERKALGFEVKAVGESAAAAVQAALEGLAAERLALQGEREALALGVAAVVGSAAAAVRSEVRSSLAGAATMAVGAVEASTRPLLEKLSGVAAGAEQAQAALRGVVLWASWRLLGWVVGAVALLVLLGWLASAAVLWWDRGTIEAEQLEKMRLQSEVAELKANYDGWVKAGVLGKLTTCGAKARPCVRVDESAGQFESQGRTGYRVIW